MRDPELDAILAKHAPRTWWLRLIGRIVVVGLLLLILVGIAGALLHPPFRLLVGWFFHLRAVLPNLSWSLEMILCSLGAAALGIAGMQSLMPRLAGRAWPWRWTLAWFGLLVMLFATSIAAVGVVHQAAWLLRSPWFEMGGRSRVIMSASNARQLVAACKLYAADHSGMLPASVAELLRDEIIPDTKILFGRLGEKMPDEMWAYLGAGLRDSDDGELPVVISPSANARGQRVIACLDGSAGLRDKTQVEAALALLREHAARKSK